jgi:GTP cyclohydrolase I
MMVAQALGAPTLLADREPDESTPLVLVVDDIVDSGRTLGRYAAKGLVCDAMVRSSRAPATLAPWAFNVRDVWCQFPWEGGEAPAEDAVVRLLQAIGEDPDRDGLRETPRRVVAALRELTGGASIDVEALVARTFEHKCDEVIALRGIRFTSLCEHHLMPFWGEAAVAYLPNPDRVIGLSKLARLVDAVARRLQLQERLTSEVASALMKHAGARGAACIVRAHHACMGCRGVRQPDAEMVTSVMLGMFRDQHEVRAELLALLRA